jgi:HK97 gp10 family phage protein
MAETYGNEYMTVKVDGLAQLQRNFERFPLAVARRLFREALHAAGEIWRGEMEARAPKLAKVKLSENPKEVRIPGDLARHIGARVEVNSDLRASVRVGPSKYTFWGLFQEIGRRAAGTGSKLPALFGGGKGRRSGGSSFMEAQPFVRPAFESKAEAVLNRFVEEGNRIVAEEIRKNV